MTRIPVGRTVLVVGADEARTEAMVAALRDADLYAVSARSAEQAAVTASQVDPRAAVVFGDLPDLSAVDCASRLAYLRTGLHLNLLLAPGDAPELTRSHRMIGMDEGHIRSWEDVDFAVLARAVADELPDATEPPQGPAEAPADDGPGFPV